MKLFNYFKTKRFILLFIILNKLIFYLLRNTTGLLKYESK